MTVSRRGSVRRMRPERNRAPPTPPASTVTRMWLPDPSVEGRALDRDAAHGAHERLDLLDRGVLARVRARLARDALLHERAAEVVAAGAPRRRGSRPPCPGCCPGRSRAACRCRPDSPCWSAARRT